MHRRVMVSILAVAVLSSCGSPATPERVPARVGPPAVEGLRLGVGELGAVSVGEDASDVIGSVFQQAEGGCRDHRLDPVGTDNTRRIFATVVVRRHRVAMIRSGTSTRTTTGAGRGWSVADLRLVYGTRLLPTVVTGADATLKVVRRTRVLQFDLLRGVVDRMSTYDASDWPDLAGKDPRAPDVLLGDVGGTC